MARKKEPELEAKNREKIAQIAKQLFMEKGIENTTMSMLAQRVGVSKSTLYVYFKSKQEVMNYLSLEAMEYFYEQLQKDVKETLDTKERFFAICNILVNFKRKYPFGFQLLVEEICVDAQALSQDMVLKRTYDIGEELNQFLIRMLGTSLKVQTQEEMFLKIFFMWGKLYGILTLADNKERYLSKMLGMSKEEVLQKNFEELYCSIEWKEFV